MSKNSFDEYICFLSIDEKNIYRCLLCGKEIHNIHIKVCNDCIQTLSQIIKEKRDENKQRE